MKQITVAIIGLGHRGRGTYAEFAKLYPQKMKIVAIADIDTEKLRAAATEFAIDEKYCFSSAEEFLRHDRLADIAFICTQDRQHASHVIPAMQKGYHILLEKPISPDIKECIQIAKVANETKRMVVVCHVLRYTAFYKKIKELIDSRIIGDIVDIQAMENVGYYHHAHSFVRGNWRNAEETSPMILAKCCHDMDIFLWLAGEKPKTVSSFGSNFLFKKECAPEGSSAYCLGGCEVKENCIFDAEKIYISDVKTGIAHGITDWSLNIFSLSPSEKSVREYLRDGQYGRCVYHCDNTVVDHQVLNILLENNATIGFTLCAFTSECYRTIKITATRGEIEASTDTQKIRYCEFGKESTIIDIHTLGEDFSGHDGGDNAMLAEFIAVLQNECTDTLPLSIIDKSVESHYVALAAESSRLKNGTPVDIDTFIKGF